MSRARARFLWPGCTVSRGGIPRAGTGYFVSTVGRDEAVIRSYIQKQEQEDQRFDQMKRGD